MSLTRKRGSDDISKDQEGERANDIIHVLRQYISQTDGQRYYKVQVRGQLKEKHIIGKGLEKSHPELVERFFLRNHDQNNGEVLGIDDITEVEGTNIYTVKWTGSPIMCKENAQLIRRHYSYAITRLLQKQTNTSLSSSYSLMERPNEECYTIPQIPESEYESTSEKESNNEGLSLGTERELEDKTVNITTLEERGCHKSLL